MKKVLMKLAGFTIIALFGLSAVLIMLLDIACLINILVTWSIDNSNGMYTMAVVTFPMLCYSLWAWTRDWSIDAIRSLLYGKN